MPQKAEVSDSLRKGSPPFKFFDVISKATDDKSSRDTPLLVQIKEDQSKEKTLFRDQIKKIALTNNKSPRANKFMQPIQISAKKLVSFKDNMDVEDDDEDEKSQSYQTTKKLSIIDQSEEQTVFNSKD